MSVGYYLTKIGASPLAGRLADRLDVRQLLFGVGILYALFFVAFPFSAPGRTWPLIAAWALAGVADALWTVGVTAALYRAVPDTPTRPAYFAVYNVISLATFAVGGVLAVPVLRYLGRFSGTIGPFTFNGFHIFYAICAVAMIPCLFSSALFPPGRGGSRAQD